MPLTLAEALRRLQSPDSVEEFSPLTGEPFLLVDLRAAAGTIQDETMTVAGNRLRELPCPTIALADGSRDPRAAAFADRCDVVVDSEDEAALVAAAARRTPLAAMALVQLLRLGAGRSVEEGLVAESLVYSTLQSGPEFTSWLAARAPRPRAQPGSGPAVLVSRTGDRLDLVLNRPERHNAFSAEMRDALVEALALAAIDRSIREIVLTGRGPSFSSGGDLEEFGTHPDPATAHAIRSTRNPGRLLAACADRLRVEVHGTCVGAGIELPAFAGRLMARADASFQLPEVGMGLVPGAGGTVSIPRRIGRQRTAYLALTGARIDAAAALRLGLVDAIVPAR